MVRLRAGVDTSTVTSHSKNRKTSKLSSKRTNRTSNSKRKSHQSSKSPSSRLFSCIGVFCRYIGLPLLILWTFLFGYFVTVIPHGPTRHGRIHAKLQHVTENMDAPTVVLHVGLPKTGTTFLQCAVCASNATLHELQTHRKGIFRKRNTQQETKNEDYLYLGTCPYNLCGLDPNTQSFVLDKHQINSFFVDPVTYDTSNPLGPVLHSQSDNDEETLLQAFGSFVWSIVTRRGRLPRIQPKLQKRIKELYYLKQNCLIIFEGLHNLPSQHIAALARLFDQWNVQIVVGYRPLYAWLSSRYNHYYKADRYRSARVWPGLPYPNNPSIIGEYIPPFTIKTGLIGNPTLPANATDNSLMDDTPFQRLVSTIQLLQQHPTETVIHNFARHFSYQHIAILPLHLVSETPPKIDEALSVAKQRKQDTTSVVNPLLEHYVCNVLYNAGNACHYVREHFNETVFHWAYNPSRNLNYDLLAVAAYQKGLIVYNPNKKTTKRLSVHSYIARYQEKRRGLTANDFPLTCWSQSKLLRLERLSLQLEQKLFRVMQEQLESVSSSANASPYSVSDYDKDQMDAEHKEGFARMVDQKAFCSVDTEQALAYPEWQAFFEDLAKK